MSGIQIWWVLAQKRVYPTYDQIAFVTQDAMNQLLKFVKSEEMKE